MAGSSEGPQRTLVVRERSVTPKMARDSRPADLPAAVAHGVRPLGPMLRIAAGQRKLGQSDRNMPQDSASRPVHLRQVEAFKTQGVRGRQKARETDHEIEVGGAPRQL